MRCHLTLVLLIFIGPIAPLQGKPTDAQIAHDAADFHKFRLTALTIATELSRKNPGTNQGSEYISAECQKLARQTSTDYIYGVLLDLEKDTSRTEEPIIIAEMLVLQYPPDDARKTLHEVLRQPNYKDSSELQAWLEDIDRIQKERTTEKSS